jgi:hypothetical protein
VRAKRRAFELKDLLDAEKEIRLSLKSWWDVVAYATEDEEAKAWGMIEDLTQKLEDIKERIKARPLSKPIRLLPLSEINALALQYDSLPIRFQIADSMETRATRSNVEQFASSPNGEDATAPADCRDVKAAGGDDRKEARAARRQQLLAAYQAEMGPISDRAIYTARNHPVCKPEWVNWKNGTLPDNSASAESIERFLQRR